VEKIDEDQHSFEDSWRVIWRRKWMILLLVLFTTAVVILGSFLVTPVYEASAMLRIKEQKPSLLGSDSSTGSAVSLLISKDEINTQIEILKSRSVLEDVIVRLDLQDFYKVKTNLASEERLFASLTRLKKDLSVSNIPNTQLIRIAIRSSDPSLAAQAVNTLSQDFIGRNVETKRGEANAVLAFVTQQADLVSARMTRTEEDLLSYKQAAGVGDLGEEAKLKVDALATIEGSYQQATVDREILDVRIRSLLEQMSPGTSQEGSMAAILRAPAIQGIQFKLAELQTQLTVLEARSSPGSQKAADIKAKIDGLRKQIQSEIMKTIDSRDPTNINKALQIQLADYQAQDIILDAQEQAWARQIKSQEEGINQLSAREIDLTRLERAQRINEDLYSSLMRARNEAGIEAASQIGNIDVVDLAVTPLKPVFPKKAENAVVAFAGSLFLALVLSFTLEYLDKSLKSEEEMKKLLGVPILGIIPRFEGSRRKKRKKGGKPGTTGLPLSTRDEPDSAAAEGFRLLRANLRFVEVDKELKTLMVTSPTPGDGKTTVAANLSMELAAQERRVLVVDADFRIPALHRIFALPHSPGLSDVLSGGRPYQSVLQRIPGVDNLDILTVGPVPPNPSELLGSLRMKQLLQELTADYTHVVFDVPPVLATTDALDLASSLDGVLLVLKMGETDRRAVRRMMDIFGNTKIRILGGVLNGVDAGHGRFRYSQYYYHYSAGRE
jgi:polysaccharide biosynthesis transport protein